MTFINLAKVTYKDGKLSVGHNNVGPLAHQMNVALNRLLSDRPTPWVTARCIVVKYIEMFDIKGVAHSPTRDPDEHLLWVTCSGLGHPVYAYNNYIGSETVANARPRTYLDTAINFTDWSLWSNLEAIDTYGVESLNVNFLQHRRNTGGYILYADPHYGAVRINDAIHSRYWGSGMSPIPESSVPSAAFDNKVSVINAFDIIFDTYLHFIDCTTMEDKAGEDRRINNGMWMTMWRSTALNYSRGKYKSKLTLHPRTTMTARANSAEILRAEFPELLYVKRKGRDITIGIVHDGHPLSVTFDFFENIKIALYDQLAPTHTGLRDYIDYIIARYEFIKWHKNASVTMTREERIANCPTGNRAFISANKCKEVSDRSFHLLCMEPRRNSRFLKILREYNV